MIISAVNLDKLSDEDMEELGKKFDREDESEKEAQAVEPMAEPAEPSAEKDLGEDAMAKLDEFINSPQLGEVDLSDYSLGEEDETANLDNHSVNHDNTSDTNLDWWEDDVMGHGGEQETEMDEKEIDLDEIKDQISRAVGETLSKHFS